MQSRFVNNIKQKDQQPTQSQLSQQDAQASRLNLANAKPGLGSSAISRFTPPPPKIQFQLSDNNDSIIEKKQSYASPNNQMAASIHASFNTMEQDDILFDDEIKEDILPKEQSFLEQNLQEEFEVQQIETEVDNFKTEQSSVISEQRFNQFIPQEEIQESKIQRVSSNKQEKLKKGFLNPLTKQSEQLLNPMLIRSSNFDQNAQINQNLYRISPFTKTFPEKQFPDTQQEIKKSNKEKIIEGFKDNINSKIDELLQLGNALQIEKEINDLQPDPINLEKTTGLEQEIFKYPPILQNLLVAGFEINSEINQFKLIAKKDINMEHKSKQDMHNLIMKKFKQKIQQFFTKIKDKIQKIIKIYDYLGQSYNLHILDLDAVQLQQDIMTFSIQQNQQKNLESYEKPKYGDLINTISHYLENLTKQLRSYNNILNQCQCFNETRMDMTTFSSLVSQSLAQAMEKENLIEQQYIANILENDFNLEALLNFLRTDENSDPFIVESFQQLPSYQIYFQETQQQLLTLTYCLYNYINDERIRITNESQQLQPLIDNFMSQVHCFERLFTFDIVVNKILGYLQDGIAFLESFKIPASSAKYKSFNEHILNNAEDLFTNAYNRIKNKYDRILDSFPKVVQQELVSEERRNLQCISLRKNDDEYIKNQISLEDYCRQSTFMLAYRILCFSNIVRVYEDNMQRVEQCQQIKKRFQELSAFENKMYRLQSKREMIKSQFHHTQNKDIIEQSLNEIKDQKSNFIEFTKPILQEKWQAYEWFVTCTVSKKQEQQEQQKHMPYQFQRLVSWIQSEFQAIEHLESLIIQYNRGFSEDNIIQFQRNQTKVEELSNRLKKIIAFEKTAKQIEESNETDEITIIMKHILETTVKKSGHNYNQSFQLDKDLEEALDFIGAQKDSLYLSIVLKNQYQQCYDELSQQFALYQIWYLVQRCKFIMDGEILGEIIKGQKIFNLPEFQDEINVQYLDLNETIEIMDRLIRGFNLQIKNNDQCVFFSRFVKTGRELIVAVREHFKTFLDFTKMSYMEKKKVNLVEVNQKLQTACDIILNNEWMDSVKDSYLSSVRFYIDRNTNLFETKAASIDWDSKIRDVKEFLLEADQALNSACDFLEKIFKSSLLDVYQPPKLGKEKVQNIAFGVDEFQVDVPELLKVQQTKVRLQKVRVLQQNILNNQVDNEEYRNRFTYIIFMLDECSLWIKAIEQLTRMGYTFMGKLKDILKCDDSINQDYQRSLRLFGEEIKVLISGIKQIESKSPYSFKKRGEIGDLKEKIPESMIIQLLSGKKIDQQILLLHKIGAVSTSALDIIQKTVHNFLIFQNYFKLGEVQIEISEEFFENLNRFITFYCGAGEEEQGGHSKEVSDGLEEPLFDYNRQKVAFMRALGEFPSYIPFPKNVLLDTFESYRQITEFSTSFNLNILKELNYQIQKYLLLSEFPIISLYNLQQDLLQILSVDVQYNKVLCRQTLTKFQKACQDSLDSLQLFQGFIEQILNLVDLDEIKKQDQLNKLSEENLMKQFVQSENQDWQKFFEECDKLINQYLENFQSNDIQKDCRFYLQDYTKNKSKVEQDIKSKANNLAKTLNYLLDLYKEFQKLFMREHELNR